MTGAIVDGIVTVVGMKANFYVGGFLAVNTLVEVGMKAKIHSSIMSGITEAKKHNCDCGQYKK